MSDSKAKKSQYRPFSETYTSSTVINEFKKRGDAYFVTIGYKVGKQGDDDKWQNANLLVDGSLHKLAQRCIDDESLLKDINPCQVTIHNLEFSAVENPEDASKPYLNTRGILARIERAIF